MGPRQNDRPPLAKGSLGPIPGADPHGLVEERLLTVVDLDAIEAGREDREDVAIVVAEPGATAEGRSFRREVAPVGVENADPEARRVVAGLVGPEAREERSRWAEADRCRASARADPEGRGCELGLRPLGATPRCDLTPPPPPPAPPIARPRTS